MTFILLAAAFLMVSGAGLLYLASPNQKLVGRTVPCRLFSIVGLMSLVTALPLLLKYSGSGTSVFILITGVMLLWTILPMAIAYFRHKQEAQK